MTTGPSVPEIVTRGDMGGNVTSFARRLRAANLTAATQRTCFHSLDRLATDLESSGLPTDLAAIHREHVEAFIENQLAHWKPTKAATDTAAFEPCSPGWSRKGDKRKSDASDAQAEAARAGSSNPA